MNKYVYILSLLAVFLIVALGGWIPGVVFIAAAGAGFWILDTVERKMAIRDRERRENLR